MKHINQSCYSLCGRGRSDLRMPPELSLSVVELLEDPAVDPPTSTPSCCRGGPPSAVAGSALRLQDGSTKSNSHCTFNLGLLNAMLTASATASRLRSGSR